MFEMGVNLYPPEKRKYKQSEYQWDERKGITYSVQQL